MNPALSVARRWLVARAIADAKPFVQHLIVPGRFVVRVQQHVRVAFDQAGHQRGARKIADGGVASLDRRGRTNGFDVIAAHEDRPALVHCLAVEDACGTQEGGGLRFPANRRLGDDPDWLREHCHHDRATDDVWHGEMS